MNSIKRLYALLSDLCSTVKKILGIRFLHEYSNIREARVGGGGGGRERATGAIFPWPWLLAKKNLFYWGIWGEGGGGRVPQKKFWLGR